MIYLSGKKVPGLPYMANVADAWKTVNNVPLWAVDNGCFTDKYPGDEKYLTWLDERREWIGTCLFIAIRDVLGDAVSTLDYWETHSRIFRDSGWPIALVLQDGMTVGQLRSLDVRPDFVFIGGSTPFKLGHAARLLAIDSIRKGIRVHMGRVNTKKRIDYAASIGCFSVDGTALRYDLNSSVFDWLDSINVRRRLS